MLGDIWQNRKQWVEKQLDRLILALLVMSVFTNALGYSSCSLAIIAASTLYFVRLVLFRRKILLPKSLWLATGLYFIAQIGCSFFALYPYYSLIWSVKYIILYSLQFFLIVALVNTRVWFYAVLSAWILGIMVVDLNVCWNYLISGLGRKSVKYLLEISVFQLPDWLNGLVWPWLMALVLMTKKSCRWAVVAAMAIVVGGTVFNGGRNVWIAAVVETLIFLLLLKKYRWAGYSVIAIAVLGGIMFQLPYIKSRMALFLDAGARTNINRIMLWRYSLDVWRDFPAFGIGNGSTFQKVFNQYYQHGFFFKERVAHSHNVFLGRLVETGIVGLMAFVCFIGGYLQHFWQQFRQSTTGNPLLLAGLVALIGWLCMGMFDYSLHLTQVTRALWIMCGLTVVAGRLGELSGRALKR
ncbi:MAG: O-antigen ligase family protein [Bacillota bacterium]